MEVKIMENKNPIKYTGKVLDKRNNLTGPDDEGKRPYPERPNMYLFSSQIVKIFNSLKLN